MRSRFSPPTVLLAVLTALTILVPGSSRSDETPGDQPIRDDFDSKLALEWKTIRPDPTHMSLETHPGKLTITTQNGSIHLSSASAKNLFLVDVPKGMDDFVVTTCIEDFLPETDWQQAGLLIYEGDDDYVKWVREYVFGFPALNVITELKRERYGSACPGEVSKERFWLRVTKRGDQYQCAASADGKKFITYCIVPWSRHSPLRVGLVAKNGPSEAGEKEAQFDFFELRNLTDAERDDPVFEIRRALLGEWTAVESQINGKTLTKGPAMRLIATPGTLTLREKGDLVVSYMVDPTTTPNRITLIPRKHDVGQLLNGVFSLDGDTLTLCLNPKLNGPAPESLESVDGDGHMFLRLERSKDEQ